MRFSDLRAVAIDAVDNLLCIIIKSYEKSILVMIAGRALGTGAHFVAESIC